MKPFCSPGALFVHCCLVAFSDLKEAMIHMLLSDDAYRYINRLNIIPIRMDAEEVSYILHVIIRYEIERDLFDGKIGLDELLISGNRSTRNI